MGAHIRSKLTYGNVTATIALFIALGGTSYAALTLPRNSVGSKQLRSRSVGTAELKTRAVNARTIRDRSIRLGDISRSARQSLRGQQGPMGPAGPPAAAYRAAVSSGGVAVLGNSRTVEHLSGTNEYRIDFGRDPSRCVFNATLATVQVGSVLEQPEAGRITVARDGARVLVRTYAANGAADEQPFHLSLGC